MAISLKLTQLLVHSNSQVVIGQVTDIFEAKEENMKQYLTHVGQLVSKFAHVNFEKVLREKNTRVDMLSREPIEGT